MEGWEQEVLDLFINRETDDVAKLQNKLCGGSINGNDGIKESVTRSCFGVNMDNLAEETENIIEISKEDADAHNERMKGSKLSVNEKARVKMETSKIRKREREKRKKAE